MKFIKLFEEFEVDKSYEDRIKEVWGVDPHNFYDIVLSSAGECDLWGDLNIDFTLMHKTPIEDNELKSCFYLSNSVIKPAPSYHNIHSIIEYKHLVVIEAWIRMLEDEDWDKVESFRDTINMRLENANIPYSMDPPDGSDDTMYMIFYKKIKV